MLVTNRVRVEDLDETLDFVLVASGEYELLFGGLNDGGAVVQFQHVTPGGLVDLSPPLAEDVVNFGRKLWLQAGQYRLHVERPAMPDGAISFNLDLTPV